jgi:hypothetical protein
MDDNSTTAIKTADEISGSQGGEYDDGCLLGYCKFTDVS